MNLQNIKELRCENRSGDDETGSSAGHICLVAGCNGDRFVVPHIADAADGHSDRHSDTVGRGMARLYTPVAFRL